MKKYNKTVQDIKTLLEKNDIEYKFFEHKPVRTSEEAVKVRPDYSLQQGAKAMIVKPKINGERTFVMLVLPGDKRFDNKKVKKVLDAKDVTFASEEEVAKLTNGVIPGGVPPFGNLFGLKVVADPDLFKNDEIVFNCGDQSASIAMKSEDYERIVKPEIVEIT